MTAPTMILLGHGSTDPRLGEIGAAIRSGVLEIRPELDVQVAYLGRGAPSGLQVVNSLVKRGVTEAVLVPLSLSEAFSVSAEVPAMIAQIQAAHPELAVTASRPIGPESPLLRVVDRRLRSELHRRRIGELDGLVFAAAGSSDLRSNALVARRARQWASAHRLPHVTAFAATGTGPTTAEAVRTLRAQGRRHIAVGSWFLFPGRLYVQSAQLAVEAGAVAVSAPLGAEPEVAEAALARYAVAAMDLVDLGAQLSPASAVAERHLTVVSA